MRVSMGSIVSGNIDPVPLVLDKKDDSEGKNFTVFSSPVTSN
jgi:hypothetical protein